MMLTDIIGLLLLGILVYVVIPLIRIVLQYTLGPKLFSKRKQLRKAGQWAIITGASDGIGKAFAQELAADGLNIMLISRTAAKLEAVADELRVNYGVQVKYVTVDFTQVYIYEKLRKEVELLPSIACLVNNVGMVNVMPAEFAFDESMRVEKIQEFIACNCLSMTAMTHLVLARLIRQDSGAALINISSFSGVQPLPYITVYSATKAFVRQLSDSVRMEVSDKNIIVQTVIPLYVATSMIGRFRGLFVISPLSCARSSLNMLGVVSLSEGHIIHALHKFIGSFLPQSRFTNWMRHKLERARARMCKQK